MKKKFRFRLQRVLDFRETEKKERENALAQENFRLASAEEHLDDIMREKDEAGLPTEVTIDDLLLYGEYHERLNREIENQRLLIVESAQAVERARDVYVEKAVETKVLETIRERRFDEFCVDQNREQRKSNDELAVQRHRFRRNDLLQGEES